GMGLMMGVQVTPTPSLLINKCREKGVILCSAGYDVIRFVPPLVITKEEIDIAVKALDESIAECAI
ncbi:MAG: aminotransferase class III-fold pyridoxal phosphate-dependent enzyme, partial [Candidatus Ornithospirochaeta sp.]